MYSDSGLAAGWRQVAAATVGVPCFGLYHSTAQVKHPTWRAAGCRPYIKTVTNTVYLTCISMFCGFENSKSLYITAPTIHLLGNTIYFRLYHCFVTVHLNLSTGYEIPVDKNCGKSDKSHIRRHNKYTIMKSNIFHLSPTLVHKLPWNSLQNIHPSWPIDAIMGSIRKKWPFGALKRSGEKWLYLY